MEDKSMYDELKMSIYDVIKQALNDFGVKVNKIEGYADGASYPNPQLINFKIIPEGANSSMYLSLNTRTKVEENGDIFNVSFFVSLNVSEDYRINYINGGSHHTNRTLGNVAETQKFELGSAPSIDLEDYGASWNGWNWGNSKEIALENYKNKTGSTFWSVNEGYLDEIYAKKMVEKAATAVNDYLLTNKEVIVKKLSTDTVYDHLNEFEHISKYEFENIKKENVPIYYRNGTSFELLDKDAIENIRYDVPYGTIIGFRRMFRYKDAIYLWFGGDEVCSLDC